MSQLTKAQAIFALSFASNTNFGLDAPLGDPTDFVEGTLWSNAQEKVKEAISTINQDLSDSAPMSLTWGPYLTATPSNDPNVASENLYVSDNAMFVASGIDPENENNQLLVVSIAGTSSTSFVAAIDEDFAVKTVSLNLPPNASSNAMVYQGGNNIQKDMVGNPAVADMPGWTDVNRTIPGFLANLVAQIVELRASGKSVEVVVTGHSLGGGLAPLLAAYVGSYSEITQYANVKVSCYTYAGPTAGDANFLNYLNKHVTLNAIVNPLDLVPKAWDPSTITDIPGMYANQPGCDGNAIDEDTIIEGVIEWAQNLTTANTTDYQFFSGSQLLDEVAMDFPTDLCLRLDERAEGIRRDPEFAEIYDSLQTIWQKVNNTQDSLEVGPIKHFLVFVIEGGHQHVKGYIDQIISSTDFADLNNYLNNYVSADIGNQDAENFDSFFILETILSAAAQFLS